MQEKTLAHEPARIVGKVYEKPRGSCGLEGNDRSDQISLESSKISILKGSYKELLTVKFYIREKKKSMTAHDACDVVRKKIGNHLVGFTINWR
jgi:hypothetical protein